MFYNNQDFSEAVRAGFWNRLKAFHTFLFQRMKCGVYGSGKEGFFEGMKVMLPEKVEEYLKASYGDFMVLPDESERIPKHINETEVPSRFL